MSCEAIQLTFDEIRKACPDKNDLSDEHAKLEASLRVWNKDLIGTKILSNDLPGFLGMHDDEVVVQEETQEQKFSQFTNAYISQKLLWINMMIRLLLLQLRINTQERELNGKTNGRLMMLKTMEQGTRYHITNLGNTLKSIYMTSLKWGLNLEDHETCIKRIMELDIRHGKVSATTFRLRDSDEDKKYKSRFNELLIRLRSNIVYNHFVLDSLINEYPESMRTGSYDSKEMLLMMESNYGCFRYIGEKAGWCINLFQRLVRSQKNLVAVPAHLFRKYGKILIIRQNKEIYLTPEILKKDYNNDIVYCRIDPNYDYFKMNHTDFGVTKTNSEVDFVSCSFMWPSLGTEPKQVLVNRKSGALINATMNQMYGSSGLPVTQNGKTIGMIIGGELFEEGKVSIKFVFFNDSMSSYSTIMFPDKMTFFGKSDDEEDMHGSCNSICAPKVIVALPSSDIGMQSITANASSKFESIGMSSEDDFSHLLNETREFEVGSPICMIKGDRSGYGSIIAYLGVPRIIIPAHIYSPNMKVLVGINDGKSDKFVPHVLRHNLFLVRPDQDFALLNIIDADVELKQFCTDKFSNTEDTTLVMDIHLHEIGLKHITGSSGHFKIKDDDDWLRIDCGSSGLPIIQKGCFVGMLSLASYPFYERRNIACTTIWRNVELEMAMEMDGTEGMIFCGRMSTLLNEAGGDYREEHEVYKKFISSFIKKDKGEYYDIFMDKIDAAFAYLSKEFGDTDFIEGDTILGNLSDEKLTEVNKKWKDAFIKFRDALGLPKGSGSVTKKLEIDPSMVTSYGPSVLSTAADMIKALNDQAAEGKSDKPNFELLTKLRDAISDCRENDYYWPHSVFPLTKKTGATRSTGSSNLIFDALLNAKKNMPDLITDFIDCTKEMFKLGTLDSDMTTVLDQWEFVKDMKPAATHLKQEAIVDRVSLLYMYAYIFQKTTGTPMKKILVALLGMCVSNPNPLKKKDTKRILSMTKIGLDFMAKFKNQLEYTENWQLTDSSKFMVPVCVLTYKRLGQALSIVSSRVCSDMSPLKHPDDALKLKYVTDLYIAESAYNYRINSSVPKVFNSCFLLVKILYGVNVFQYAGTLDGSVLDVQIFDKTAQTVKKSTTAYREMVRNMVHDEVTRKDDAAESLVLERKARQSLNSKGGGRTMADIASEMRITGTFDFNANGSLYSDNRGKKVPTFVNSK